MPYINITDNLASLTDHQKKKGGDRDGTGPKKPTKNQAWTTVLFAAAAWLLFIYDSLRRRSWNFDFWIISIMILQKVMKIEQTPYPPLMEQNTSVVET